MSQVAKMKANRRANVAALLEAYGQTTLAEKTGIAAAYLFQISKGEGKSARPVNDRIGKAIEDTLGLPRGWIDEVHGLSQTEQIQAATRAKAEATRAWPFNSIKRERFEGLTPGQKMRIEGVLLDEVAKFEKAAEDNRDGKVSSKSAGRSLRAHS